MSNKRFYIVYLFFKPFLIKPDLKIYSLYGYLLLFPFVFLCVYILNIFGLYVDGLLPESYIIITVILNFFFSNISSAEWSAGIPLTYSIFLVYFYILARLPTLRIRLGTMFSDIFIKFLDWSILAGEFSIKHRSLSLFFMLIISLLITATTVSYISTLKKAARLEVQSRAWMNSVLKIVEYSTLTGGESTMFKEAILTWNDDFSFLDKDRATREKHLAIISILRLLSNTEMPQDSNMSLVESKIQSLYATAMQQQSREANQTHLDDILNLILAKIQLRLAKDDCSGRTHLIKAFSYLELIPETTPFTRARLNAYGNLYNCSLLHTIRNPEASLIDPQSGDQICDDVYMCAINAISSYMKAADGQDVCSQESRRSTNNILDLKLKLALHYADPAMAPAIREPLDWLLTPEALISQISKNSDELLMCISTEPFTPLLLMTIAQAHGAVAALHAPKTQERERALSYAGLFLNLGYIYSPSDIQQLDLNCFCSAVDHDLIEPAFFKGLTTVPWQPEDSLKLFTERLKRTCATTA